MAKAPNANDALTARDVTDAEVEAERGDRNRQKD